MKNDAGRFAVLSALVLLVLLPILVILGPVFWPVALLFAGAAAALLYSVRWM